MSLAIPTGNRCGHDPKSCRQYVRPPHFERAPYFINKARNQVIKYYNTPSEYLTRLETVNGSTAQQKTERREAITATLELLLEYCDLDTHYVGTFRKDGSHNNLSIPFISRGTGFGRRRIQRAVKELEISGYIKIKRNRKPTEQGWHHSTEIFLNRHLFLDLGISGAFINNSQYIKRESKKPNCRKEFTPTRTAPKSFSSAPGKTPFKPSPKKVSTKLTKGVGCWGDILKVFQSVNDPP